MDQKLDKKGLGLSQIKSVLMVLFYFVLIHVFSECLLSIYGESRPVLNSKVKITDGIEGQKTYVLFLGIPLYL